MKKPAPTKKRKKARKGFTIGDNSIPGQVAGFALGLALKSIFGNITIEFSDEPEPAPQPDKTIDVPETDYKIIE